MSDVYALRSRLREEESRNREYHRMLNELSSGIVNAHNRMNNFECKVRQDLSDSSDRINSSHENIIRAQELQMEIDKLYVRFKNMEMANKRIRECNNKKYYDFTNYTTIRKIVQGILDNLNLNMISDKVIYKAVEKKHLTTPNYWLTSVLISIMAWKNDDRDLAMRAEEVSLELDKKNSSIFYMLFNIRMGRESAALKWFLLYQECELKGSDSKTFLLLFSMLCKTMDDEIDEKMKYEILEYVHKVIGTNAKQEGFSEQDILNLIEKALGKMKKEDNSGLVMLQRCLEDYQAVTDTVMLAENNIQILQFLMDIRNVSDTEKNEFIEQFIQDEISRPNSEEQEVYNTIEYNELIISCNGDKEKANSVYKARLRKREHDLNLINEMIDWIFDTSHEKDVNGQIRKNMFILLLELQKKGIEQYIQTYRSRVTFMHRVNLGDYQSDVDFRNRNAETGKIEKHYTEERDNELSKLNQIKTYIGAGIGALGIGIAAYTAEWACLIITAVGAGLSVYNVVSNNVKRKHILETCQMNIKSKNEIMNQVFEEYKKLESIYEEYDAYSEKVLDELEKFAN